MSRWLKAAIAAVVLLPVVSWYANTFIGPLEAARDGSGNYTVPNTFAPGDTISSADHNANFSDIGTEITNSLPRDGQAGMTGQFKAANGTVSAPGISFTSDTNTGFYRIAADEIGVSIGGTKIGEFTSAGFAGTGGAFTSQIACGARSSDPTGWLKASGLTIGNASSGGTARANADTEDLFTELWNSHTNTELPIQDSAGSPSTRGLSASADFDANKRLPLPDLQGRVVAGKDDMSGTSANRLTDANDGLDGDTLGDTGGGETQVLIAANNGPHTHGGPAHTHTFSDDFTTSTDALTVAVRAWPGDPDASASDGARLSRGGDTGSSSTTTNPINDHNHIGSVSGTTSSSGTGATDSSGSGTAFGVVQPTYVANCFIKL